MTALEQAIGKTEERILSGRKNHRFATAYARKEFHKTGIEKFAQYAQDKI